MSVNQSDVREHAGKQTSEEEEKVSTDRTGNLIHCGGKGGEGAQDEVQVHLAGPAGWQGHTFINIADLLLWPMLSASPVPSAAGTVGNMQDLPSLRSQAHWV